MRRLADLAAVCALMLFPSAAFATCDGQDLRDTLAPAEIRELRARAAEVAFHEGIAFEAVRGEVRLTLFGTVHVHDPGVFVPEDIAARIEAADLVLVEVPSDVMADFERTLAENHVPWYDVNGPGLKNRLTAREWETLRGAFSALDIEPAAGDRMRPWFAALMLASAPCDLAARAAGAKLLDERAEALARDTGVVVGGLDGGPEQLLSFFSDMPEEEQLDLLRWSLAAYVADGGYIVTVIGAWRDEEIALIWELTRAYSAASSGDAASVDVWLDRIHETLIAARNRDWMKTILERSGVARHVVVVVGAMHLPGEDGLVRLVERAGFAIRRLSVL